MSEVEKPIILLLFMCTAAYSQEKPATTTGEPGSRETAMVQINPGS